MNTHSGIVNTDSGNPAKVFTINQNGCSPSVRIGVHDQSESVFTMGRNMHLASESQKRANDALFKGLEQQQSNLTADARQLERLQAAAQGATGQMQAVGFANQLAANQANQLLQIRGLLIAQQNAVTSRMQAQADMEAQQQAAGATSRESRIERTASPKNWLELTR